MKQEIFIPVIDYEDYYEISNFGNVRSKKRVIEKSNGIFQPIDEKILKNICGSNGYYNISLCRNGIRKIIPIHHLVAIHFLNHTINGHIFVINHKDENKLNNNVENLEIVTKRDNTYLSSKILNNKTSSKFIGVLFRKDRNKWVSRIRIGNKIKRAHFNTEEEAKNDYITKKNKLNELQFKN